MPPKLLKLHPRRTSATSPRHNPAPVPQSRRPSMFPAPAPSPCPRDSRCRARGLARHEMLAPPRRLVIVKNAIGHEQAVGFPVNPRQIRRERFRATVRTRRPCRRLFRLRTLAHIAKNLGARSMIKLHRGRLLPPDLEPAQRRHPHLFGSRFGNLETQAHMALAGQMIKLRRPHSGENTPQRGIIAQIA